MVIGTLVIWTIKFLLRPANPSGEFTRFFLGIAPNLLGSFLIPFGAYCFFNGRDNMLARIFRLQSIQDLRFVCMLGFGLVVINEYLQLIPYFGRTFDGFDILFSVAGTVCSYFLFAQLQQRYSWQSA